MKKFVVIFIVVAIVLTGVTAFLQFRRVPEKFDEVDGGVELVRYSGISTETSYTVPEKDKEGRAVVSLKDFSISNCEYLIEIVIGPGVLNITNWSITNNRKLQKISVDAANPNYQSIDGVLFSKDGKTLLAYPNSKDLVEKVEYDEKDPTKIKKEWSEGNYVVKEGVTEISDNAFYKCKNVATVTLPSTITRIGDRAFHECDLLKDIKIPSGVTYIGADAYSYNYGIVTEVVIPSSVTEIGDYAFFNAQNVLKFVYKGTEAEFNQIKQGKKWRPIPDGKLWGKVALEFGGNA